tara:strand:+ start:589 stop:978 length:390 start_codon:yes stop_codon:yes gene_type:complete
MHPIQSWNPKILIRNGEMPQAGKAMQDNQKNKNDLANSEDTFLFLIDVELVDNLCQSCDSDQFKHIKNFEWTTWYNLLNWKGRQKINGELSWQVVSRNGCLRENFGSISFIVSSIEHEEDIQDKEKSRR